ncbi:MAG: ABC transporter substrate-binding protein [Sphaerotilus natans subsp. sulfidivorans]|uniref:ABC transporter substrate-binding protein n=1 Tax=Sphaerotilus sulfidivorans TaxID=639200 RepID=UPI002357D8BA|nr:ABC transporter substrate-binding protein [Sphaerotilus sulfidivorans]MCK6403831.1 ABC transporter substrate-binding protein [Sphaerotilus sulfidivorans]
MQRRFCLKSAAAAALVLAGSSALAQEATLRFSWWGGGERHETTLKAIAAFEARNPGVKIKGEYMGFNGYQERLTTQIAGGQEPDIMQINWAWLATYSKTGEGFYDLNQSRQHLALKEFSEEELRMGTVAGKLNGLPTSYTARLFVWNRAAFDRAGMKPPATWDELFAAGKAFQAKNGDKAYVIDGELYDMILLSQTYIHQKHGTPYVDPAAPKVAMSPQAVLEWVQTYKKLVDGKTATPLPYRASLGGAEKPTEQQPDWVTGTWAGNYTWDSVLRLRASTLNKEQKLDIGDFLTVPGAKNSGMFGRPSLLFVVSKRSKHAEVAARFLNFMLTDPEAARILGVTRGVPAADSQYKVLVDEKRIDPLEQKAFSQIKAAKDAGRITLPSPLFESPRMQKFMREVFEQLAYGKITEQQAATRLLDEGNALLSRLK